VPSMAAWPIMTLGFLEVSLGNHLAAAEILEPNMFVFQKRSCTDPMTAWGLADAIEALVGIGRFDAAASVLEKWEADAQITNRPWPLALSARCRAMFLAAQGDVDAAVGVAELAIREHDRLPMPFEKARTLLLLGQLQRRKRQKQGAVDSFEKALQAFEEMGAPLWANRVREELARTNVVGRADTELTPSEQRVAELAASGMTTRDIAAALFISPKTVEHNIGKIYRKLGIRTRAELGRRIQRR
jgi:DNA-binding CsgD family transcriptional regulator